MIVRRLTIADHPLLCELNHYAARLEAPPPPYLKRGDFFRELLDDPPSENRNRPDGYEFQIMQWRQPEWMPDDATISAVNYFPALGGIGWHTDSGAPGWRVYVARPVDPRLPGSFHYEGGAMQDRAGMAIAFFVTGLPCDSWHAVQCDGPRFSVGIRFPIGATARALGLL